jgi:outer membrane protein TolC
MTLCSILALNLPAWGATRPPAPEELSLDEALQRAQKHNPVLAGARARVEQARLELETQRMWWARTMRANMNVGTMGFGAPMLMTEGTLLPMAAVGVNINLGDVLTAPHNVARAEQAVRLLEAEERRAQLEVSNLITQAYYDYSAAQRLATLSDDTINTADTDVRVAERQFSRGLSAVNQVTQARLGAQRARGDATLAAVQVHKAWSQLITLVGDPSLQSHTSTALKPTQER